MFLTSYSVTYCMYIPGKPGICFHYYCAVYDEWKYSDTSWLADRTRLFVQYTISLSSLCKLIWRHWPYKMPVKIYFVECVSKIKHILSVIHYTICGAVCFQFTHFLCDDWENIYTLFYYHHQTGSMNYYPLFRVRSWNNGVRCMSFYILMGIPILVRHLYIEMASWACFICNFFSHWLRLLIQIKNGLGKPYQINWNILIWIALWWTWKNHLYSSY